MGMPFIDLKAQYAGIKERIQQRIDAVLEHGRYINGPEVAELEEALARFSGATHVVGCASGTDALLMPLMAWGIGPGDAVFLPPFTFIATAEVVALLGATPVFVDVEVETFNMDPARLELAVRALREGDPSLHPLPANHAELRPRAVIPVDLFGVPADYAAIGRIAAQYDLLVLEDGAQGFGGSRDGQMAGSFGHAAATSFFPAKPLGCYGDGGAVFTDDAGLHQALVSIRSHGMGQDRYHHVRIGINGRIDTMQAAILLVKLEVFAEEIAARQRVAARYEAGLSDLLATPKVPEGIVSAWAQYSVRHPRREELRAALAEKGIPTAVYYPLGLHRQPAFAQLGYAPDAFPVSEALAADIFSLPMHPWLEESASDEVIAAVRDVLA